MNWKDNAPMYEDMTAVDTATISATRPAVFYDGGCPLCRREIDFYRGLRGADGLDWIDVNADWDQRLAPGLSRCDAMARFHVRDGDGKLVSGARAFIVLWRTLPAFRLVGLILSVPPMPWIAEQAYQSFLWLRPRLIRRQAN